MTPNRPSRTPSLILLWAAVACADDGTRPSTVDVPPATVASAIGVGYARTDLGTLGGPTSQATDINNLRIVVGWSITSAGAMHAFRWTSNRGMVDLGTLPGHDNSKAVAINDDGRILGVSYKEGVNSSRTVVVWSATGVISALPIPLNGPGGNEPTDFSPSGVVVGWDSAILQHGWAWSAARGKTDLILALNPNFKEGLSTAVNLWGTVLMISSIPRDSHCDLVVAPQCWRAFLWTYQGGFRSLGTPEGFEDLYVFAYGMNNSETVVGDIAVRTRQEGPVPASGAYTWSKRSGFTMLPCPNSAPLGSCFSTAAAVNEWGTVAGRVNRSSAVVWPFGGSPVRLEGGASSNAVALNDLGAVVGFAGNAGSEHATMWTLGITF